LTIMVHGVGAGRRGSGRVAGSRGSGVGSFVVGPTCNYTGGGSSASCIVVIRSTTTGTTVVHAASDIPVSGQSIHKETDGTGSNSNNANKVWVDANIDRKSVV